jgi:hypothetical protein
VLLVGLFVLSGTAQAHRVTASTIKKKSNEVEVEVPANELCIVHSLPSFIDQGEFETHSSVADLIEVECSAVFAEHYVEISAHELASRCPVDWIKGHSPPMVETGPSVKKVQLDDAGNAEVALLAGPSCAAGEVLISAHLEEAPFSTVTTAFTVLAPNNTIPGVLVFGATGKNVQVEDDFDSSLFAIVQVEFPSVYAEEEVVIAAEQLFARCHVPPKLIWVGSGLFVLGSGTEFARVKLDDNGNAFVLILAEESCASGTSLIEASLAKAPYTTYTTEFTIESPHETI